MEKYVIHARILGQPAFCGVRVVGLPYKTESDAIKAAESLRKNRNWVDVEVLQVKQPQ